MANNPLTNALRETLALFDNGMAPRTTSEIASELDLGRRSTYDRLERLVDRDCLRTKKVGANARVWWRPPTDDDTDEGKAHPKFDSFVDAAEEYAVFLLNPDGYVRTWNPGAEEIKGYAEEEIVGEHFSIFYPKEQREANAPERNLTQAARDGSIEDEGWRVRADGTKFWANVTITVIRDDEGDLEGFAKVTRDMTDRHERERELRRERDLVKRVLDTVPVGVSVVSAEGELVRTNERAKTILDEDPERGLRTEDRRLYDENGDRVPVEERPSTQAFETGESVRDWRCQIEDPNGGRRWLTVNAAPLEGEDGEIERVVVAGKDVTQLKEQARQLERQRDDLESELEEIFERIDDGFFALDEDLCFVHLNDQAADALGRAASESIGEFIWDALEPGPKAEAAFEEALETGESVTFEEYYEPLEVWFETHVYPSETGLSVYFQDITERKHRRQELKRYRSIVETMSEGIYVVDDDGYITLVNDQYAAMFDRSKDELQGAPVSAVIDDESTLEQAFRLEAELVDGKRDSAKLEAELQRSNGEPWVGEATFTVTATDGGHERVGVVRDVTERKERERELEQYETIVSTMEDGVYILDDDFEFVKVNAAYIEMTGYDRDELLGTHCSLVVDDEVTAESAQQLEEMLAGAADAGVIEADIHRADGSMLRAESRFTAIGGDDRQQTHKIGVVRDVSERVGRERELEEYRRWTQTLMENFPSGAVALVDENLRYITFGGEPEGETSLTRDDIAGEHVQEVLPTQIADVVVPAYEDALDGTSSEFEETIDDQIYQFHFVPVRDDDGEVFAATAMSQEVTQQVEHKHELERQREELAALNNLNHIVREITEAVIEQSTREEIEATVCDHLAESESYNFAWIAGVDPQTMALDPHVEAGIDGYLDEVPTSMDPDEPSGQGPGARAIRTQEIQTTQDAMTDPDFEPWREHAKTYGYRSAAGIPIIHEGTLYGLIGVYADRSTAFESQEKEVMGQLGEIVGHAIAAAERKQALMSDELIELAFHIDGIIDELGVSMPADERITLDHAIPRGDDEFLVYGTATPDAVETVHDIADALDHWGSVEFRGDGDPLGFELRMSDPPVLSTVASLGGYVEEAVVTDGAFDLRIHLAPSVDVRRVIDAVEAAYPSAEMRRRQQITRDAADPHRMQQELLADLTEKQRTTLKTAYHAGFFGWPRDITGEEVADSLGVASPTFHQHLRKAEKKVFDSLLSGETLS